MNTKAIRMDSFLANINAIDECEKEIRNVLMNYFNSDYSFSVECEEIGESKILRDSPTNIGCTLTIENDHTLIYGAKISIDNPKYLKPEYSLLLDSGYIKQEVIINGAIQRVYEVLVKYKVDRPLITVTTKELSFANIDNLMTFSDGVKLSEAVKRVIMAYLRSNNFYNSVVNVSYHRKGWLVVSIKAQNGKYFESRVNLRDIEENCPILTDDYTILYEHVMYRARMIVNNFKNNFNKKDYNKVLSLFDKRK